MEAALTVETPISNHLISGLLCCAFEGGSNYWYQIEEYEFADGVSIEDFREGGRFTDPDRYWHPAQIIPLHTGCAVIVSDTIQGDVHRLDREALQKGLRIMASDHPRHYADFIGQNDDADTGDVFLQCCLFGDIIFG